MNTSESWLIYKFKNVSQVNKTCHYKRLGTGHFYVNKVKTTIERHSMLIISYLAARHRDAKGLIFYRCGFFFFFLFSTPDFWRLWTDLNQTGTHIHLWLLFEKFGPNSPGIYHRPYGLGAKNRLLVPTLNFNQTYISAAEHDINNRKETCQFTGTPLHACQIWWTSSQKWLRTVVEFLPTP